MRVDASDTELPVALGVWQRHRGHFSELTQVLYADVLMLVREGFYRLREADARISRGVERFVIIPYVTEQLPMARLSRATFALYMSILPATATAIGFFVLRQVPTILDLLGIGLVIVGIALHRAE